MRIVVECEQGECWHTWMSVHTNVGDQVEVYGSPMSLIVRDKGKRVSVFFQSKEQFLEVMGPAVDEIRKSMARECMEVSSG